jgi:hypothetical protein
MRLIAGGWMQENFSLRAGGGVFSLDIPFYRTFQDRLISKLRLANANDLDSANQVLRRFLPYYNCHFGRAPAMRKRLGVSLPKTSIASAASITSAASATTNVVQWDGRRFQIPPQPQRFSFAGAKVQLVESLEGKVSIYYADTKLHLHLG